MQSRILVVDDEAGARRQYLRVLERAGYLVESAESGEAALERAGAAPFDVVLSDVRMPGMGGIALCHEFCRLHPDTIVVLITGHQAIDDAVAGMRVGARDYVTKPCEPEQLVHVIRRAIESRDLSHENRRLRARLSERDGAGRILGESAAIERVRSLVARLAESDSPVLVRGESGSGKELVARAIHVESGRAAGPFVAVNACSLAASVFERELFGHCRGAFTGAEEDRPGLFEAAGGGTLFLDEIGELAPELQPKLLRVIEQREVIPVGGVRGRPVDARVIAATHRDLESDIEQGRFRRDLFYRLNVLDIRVPSLAERRDDIAQLAGHFLGQRTGRAAGPVCGFSPEALEYLKARAWPGNVRELANLVERAVALSPGPRIGLDDLQRADGASPPERPRVPYPFVGLSLAAVTRRHIDHVLDGCGGSPTRACEILGISRSTLWEKTRNDPEK